jgi:hypothetical protein
MVYEATFIVTAPAKADEEEAKRRVRELCSPGDVLAAPIMQATKLVGGLWKVEALVQTLDPETFVRLCMSIWFCNAVVIEAAT